MEKRKLNIGWNTTDHRYFGDLAEASKHQAILNLGMAVEHAMETLTQCSNAMNAAGLVMTMLKCRIADVDTEGVVA